MFVASTHEKGVVPVQRREVHCRPCKLRFDLFVARLHIHGQKRGVEMQEKSVELLLKWESKLQHKRL